MFLRMKKLYLIAGVTELKYLPLTKVIKLVFGLLVKGIPDLISMLIATGVGIYCLHCMVNDEQKNQTIELLYILVLDRDYDS